MRFGDPMTPTRPPRARTPGAAALTGLLLMTACAQSTVEGDAPPSVEVVSLGELHDALYPTLMDTVLAGPFDFVIAHDRIWMAEPNVSRVSVLTTDFRLLGRIGRRGEGPGEIMSPMTVRVRDGVVSVADNSTGRFELFDTAGVGLGSHPWAGGWEHALLGRDEIVALDRDPATLGTRSGPEGPQPFGRSTDDGGGLRGPLPMDQMHAATLDGEPVVVLVGEATGSLLVIDLDGNVIETRALPPGVLKELAEEEEKLARMFGGALAGSNLTKGVGVSPDGRFVSIATSAESAPVLIHDLDGRRLFLVNVSGHRQAGKVQSAGTTVYDDGLLYVLSGGSMFAFELDLPG